MLFNSIDYLIFLPTVFFIYWTLLKNSVKFQNWLILTASIVFYGWWDWRYLSLLVISSLTDYLVGIKLSTTTDFNVRKRYLYLSLFFNLGLLCFYKYFNFFIESFVNASYALGIHPNITSLNIILPVGISFYTFQTLSYTIDVYRNQLKAERNLVVYFSFVTFFPQLVAGPIERAKNLLQQFENARKFEYDTVRDGFRQILWGLFKKIVIADTCAENANYIFTNHETFSGNVLVLGVVFFAFQIYGDFSGYSDIAIGSAKLFGIRLMTNFHLPYFSASVVEFWRRWHISLSTWFRDYVYIPLGGSRGNKLFRARNTLLTFTLSGLWHGANWTFVIWGFLNGLYYLPHIFRDSDQAAPRHGWIRSKLADLMGVSITFALICFSWIFFRSDTVTDAFRYISRMFSENLFTYPTHHLINGKYNLVLIAVLVGLEWIQRNKSHCLELSKAPLVFRWVVYWVLACIILYHQNSTKTFIYFQF